MVPPSPGARTKQKSAETTTVLLPRGVYATSRTLRVPSGVAVVGVAKHLSRIVPVSLDGTDPLLPAQSRFKSTRSGNSDQSAVLPVMETVGANVTLAFLSIGVWNAENTTSAIHWCVQWVPAVHMSNTLN